MLIYIGLLILAIIIIYFVLKLFLWLFEILDCKIHHIRFKDRPKLKRGLLKGYLREKYGKREGKRIYRSFKTFFKKEGIK